MRKIDKKFRPIPEKLKDCFQERQENLLKKEELHQFDSQCYNSSIKEDLKKLYHNKCAFCESKLNEIPNDSYQFTVEHFRPKKGTNSYFWLGYEWSNLMPSCQKCNGKKDDNFRLPNKRKKQKLPLKTENGQKIIDLERCRADGEELLAENPFLLHPELENPMDFLAFDINKLGYFIENIQNKRAKYTIDLCQLNRSDLWEKRKKIYDNFLTELKDKLVELVEIYGADYTEKELKFGFHSIFKKMYFGAIEEQTEYCSFRLFLIENFEILFLEKIEADEMKDILSEAFVLFLNDVEIN